jgi:type VI secretion system secreted protein Hcp
MRARYYAASLFLLLFIGSAVVQGQAPARAQVAPARVPQTTASDCFMKIEGVKGESKGKEHKDWIDLVSFSVPARPSARASAPGRATLSKKVDKASPKLRQYIASGKAIPTVLVECPAEAAQSSRPQTYLRYQLEQVVITSSGAAATRNTESLSLNFGKIKMEKSSGDVILKGKKILEN